MFKQTFSVITCTRTLQNFKYLLIHIIYILYIQLVNTNLGLYSPFSQTNWSCKPVFTGQSYLSRIRASCIPCAEPPVARVIFSYQPCIVLRVVCVRVTSTLPTQLLYVHRPWPTRLFLSLSFKPVARTVSVRGSKCASRIHQPDAELVGVITE